MGSKDERCYDERVMLTKLLPLIFGMGVFLLVVGIVLYRVRGFLRKIKARPVPGQQGKSAHIDTPFGVLEVKPYPARDAGMDSIPKYPNAAFDVTDGAQQLETQVNLFGRSGRQVSQSARTPDPFKQVSDYYELNFPDWKQDIDYDSGYRLQQAAPGQIRTITLVREPGGTRIQYDVLYSAAFGTTIPLPRTR